MRIQFHILISALCTVSLTPLQAGVLAQSTFDSGDDGWRVGDFFAATGGSIPTFVPAGGNPGGFVRTPDLFDWNAYQAPLSFLGNQSAAYGGSLALDERILSSDGVNYPMAVISDGATMLQFRTTPPGTSWTSYSIPLVASAGWEVADGSGDPGPAATEAQLMSVLSSLTFLHLDADWQTGLDQVDLDNVRLNSRSNTVPDGGSAGLLLGFALVGLGATRSQLKRI